jgi:hypothetical protein
MMHTRDVLVTLRHAYSFSYVVIYAYSMSEMLVNLGFVLAIGPGEYSPLDLYFVVAFFAQFLKSLIERITYTRMQDQVDAIREAYQQVVVHYRRSLTADEIGEIWPTDWIESDLGAYLSDVLTMVVFAINLQQIAAKRLNKIAL